MRTWLSLPARPGDEISYLVKCYVPPPDAEGWQHCMADAQRFARMLGEAATYLRSFKAAIEDFQEMKMWVEQACVCLSCGAQDLRTGAFEESSSDRLRDSLEMA